MIKNRHGDILDLILVSNEISCSCNRTKDPIGNEDLYHPALQCEIVLDHGKIKNKRQGGKGFGVNSRRSKGNILNLSMFFSFDFKKGDFDGLINELASVDWNSVYEQDCVDGAINEFYNTFISIIEKYVPTATSRRPSNYPNWMSHDTIKLIKKKNRISRMIHANPLTDVSKEYHELREKTKNLIAHDKEAAAESVERRIRSNPKDFLKMYAEITGKSGKNNNCPSVNSYILKYVIIRDKHEVPNAFAKYFAENFNDDSNKGCDDFDKDRYGTFNFSYITGEEIATDINKMKSGFRSIPGFLPPTLIKGCKHWIIPPLEYIFNLSLFTGRYPERLKRSVIIPHLKSGAPNNIVNYRPIGSSDTIAKIFERLIAGQINEFIKDKINPSQHGFLENRSTITNLAVLTKDVADNIALGNQVDVMYMDFRKAFDNVQYDILRKDMAEFGFSEISCDWIMSLLDHRSIYVYFDGIFSDQFSNSKGTPQGSPISVVVFNLKINSVANVVSYSQLLLFADDFKVYRAIRNRSDSLLLQEDINNIISWSKDNRLYFNSQKCFVMSFHRGAVTTYQYLMDNSPLIRCNSLKDLGITFNDDLSFRDHIGNITSRANRNLGLLKRSTVFIYNFSSLVLLFNVFIRSILEYGAVIWCPYIIKDVHIIDLVQNNFLRFAYYKLYGSTARYDTTIYNSVTSLKSFFQVASLEKRRNILTLCFFKKIVDDPDLKNILFRNILVPDVEADLRNRRIFSIPLNIRTNVLQNTAVYRFCSLYNSLFNNNNIIEMKFVEFRKKCEEVTLEY